MNRSARFWSAVSVAAFFLLLLAMLIARAMTMDLNRDEEQFIAAGALLLRDGYLPTRDYPYFHLPNLAFIYAGLFSCCNHLLLAARSFNVVCAWLSLGFIFAVTADAFRALRNGRWIMAGLATLVFFANELVRFTAGWAWNHDLPLLATLAALAALWRSWIAPRTRNWLVLSGALLGLAIGTRLSFLPLLMPFLFVVFFRSADHRGRLAAASWFSLGALVALAPSLILWACAPNALIFDNFVYNGRVNSAFRESVGTRGARLDHKLLFPLQLLRFPQNLALVVAFGYLAIWLPLRRGFRSNLTDVKIASLLVCFPFVVLGAFAPSPSYKQYYYAPVPFLLLAVVFGLANAWDTIHGRRARFVAGVLVVVSLPFLVVKFSHLRGLASPETWPVLQIHDTGRQIQALTKGSVLTFSPIFPLEGGIGIYKEFATGRFAWRVAPFVPDEQERSLRIIGAANLEEYLSTKPPSAILVGPEEPHLSAAFVAYARAQQYHQLELDRKLTLWLRPE